MMIQYLKPLNTVLPNKAIVTRNTDMYNITIFGIDSFDDEIQVASYSHFPSLEYALDKAKEFRIPKSQTIYQKIR